MQECGVQQIDDKGVSGHLPAPMIWVGRSKHLVKITIVHLATGSWLVVIQAKSFNTFVIAKVAGTV